MHWQWPWNYGLNTVIGNIIRLYWSGSTGTLKAYKPVTVTGLAKTGCLVSSGANIYHVVTN